MNAGALNVGSILIGLLAWFLPIYGILRRSITSMGNMVIAAVSMSCCATALCFQILYNNHLVNTQNWTALQDTTQPLSLVSLILLGGTLLLNTAMLIIGHFRKPVVVYLK